MLCGRRASVLAPADRLALAEDLASFEHDPLGYVLWAFPWGKPGTELENERGPRTWQAEFLGDVGERLGGGATAHEAIKAATASGHGIGKSALVAWLVRWAMATREDTRGVVTANTDTQLRTKTWPEVSKWHRLALDRDMFVCTATSLYSADDEHEKTWRVDAVPWSENNTEAFAGLHNKGARIVVVFDEASSIADKVWEVTEGALTDENTEIVWSVFGNPTVATGRFRECFRRYKHRWITRQIDSRTVEGTNKAEIDKWVADNGEDSDFVKVRVRGLFPSLSAKQFISEADVDAAYGRHLRAEQYNWAPVVISVDPAWEGVDELVIARRQGLAFSVLRTLPKNDNDVWVANEIARLEDEHQADAVVVDGGYGTGIVSAGRTMGREWIIVWFSGESNDPGCLNKRAEMTKSTRDWLKEGGAIPEDPMLRDELLALETVARMDGKIQIVSKDVVRKTLGRSPNRSDALGLTFAVNVASRAARARAPANYAQNYDVTEAM